MNDMNKNLFTEDRRTDSRKISFMLFGNTDNHRNLLAIIRKMLNDMSNLDIDLNKHIELSSYKDAKNEDRVMYLLSEFGYIMLTMYISRNDLILYVEAPFYMTEMVCNIDEHRDFKFTLINNKVLMISSLELAKIFNKEHKDILSKIRIVLDNCSFNFNALNSCCMQNKTDTYNGGYREDDVYYVTRNMYALLIACYNNTTDEILRLKHKLIVLFDRTIKSLNDLRINGLKNLERFSSYFEERENFDYNYFKAIEIKDAIKKHWEYYKEVYPGLDEELTSEYNEVMNRKGCVCLTDILFSSFHFNTKKLATTQMERVIFYRPYFHQFLVYLGIYSSKADTYGSTEPYRKPNVFIEKAGLISIKRNYDDQYDFNTFSLDGARLITILRGAFIEYVYNVVSHKRKESLVKFFYEFYDQYKPLMMYTTEKGVEHKIGWDYK